jgi:hypothetical protein
MVQIILICSVIIICIAFFIYVMQKNNYLRNEYLSLKTMFDNMNSYVFLIGNSINVIKTNYYQLNPDAIKDQPLILGNVLRCKNGCDAGLCGKSPYCAQCPIREHISDALQTKKDFKNLETHMHMYTTNHNTVETDVIVDGKYVEINKNVYMVITVKDITSTKTLQHLYLEEKLKSQRDSKRYLSLIGKIIDNISLPFNTLSGYVTMFLNAKTSEELENSVKFIGTQAVFIKNWIEDFVSHDIIGQIKLDIVNSNAKIKTGDMQTALPKLLVSTLNEDLFNKIKDYTINKFSVEMKRSDIDLVAYAVTLFNVYAVIVDLPEDRTDNLINTLHGIKPKLPILILTNNINKDALRSNKSTNIIYISRTFNQTDLVNSLNVLDV